VKPDPESQQRWITFLRNHREAIAGMDFFVVPSVRFRLLGIRTAEQGTEKGRLAGRLFERFSRGNGPLEKGRHSATTAN
jgi:hypothetical protein